MVSFGCHWDIIIPLRYHIPKSRC